MPTVSYKSCKNPMLILQTEFFWPFLTDEYLNADLIRLAASARHDGFVFVIMTWCIFKAMLWLLHFFIFNKSHYYIKILEDWKPQLWKTVPKKRFSHYLDLITLVCCVIPSRLFLFEILIGFPHVLSSFTLSPSCWLFFSTLICYVVLGQRPRRPPSDHRFNRVGCSWCRVEGYNAEHAIFMCLVLIRSLQWMISLPSTY